MTNFIFHVVALAGVVQLLFALGLGKGEKHQTLKFRQKSAVFAIMSFCITVLGHGVCWCQPVIGLLLLVSIAVLFTARKKSL